MNKLTVKQAMVLEAIENFIKENGYSPTVRELSYILKIDISNIFEKLTQLERKGYIKTTFNKSRSIVVLKGCDNVD